MNPYAEPPACSVCNDIRMVEDRRSTTKCPVCGCSCPKPEKGQALAESCDGCRKFGDLKRTRMATHHARPEMGERDLTPREREQVAEWRLRYPKTSFLTMMGWIEGGRYEPSKDETFLKEVALMMPTPEEQVDRHLGPLPGWLTRRLAGVSVETTPGQERFLAAWKTKYP